ncbi:hypothetical protein ACI2JA_04195 [Alkalihalobacillus sp. NPDC078783]
MNKTDFLIKRNDTSDMVYFDVPALVNLVGAKVQFLMRDKPVRDSDPEILFVNSPADIDGQTLVYRFGKGDAIRAGFHYGEFRVTFANGHVKSFPEPDPTIKDYKKRSEAAFLNIEVHMNILANQRTQIRNDLTYDLIEANKFKTEIFEDNQNFKATSSAQSNKFQSGMRDDFIGHKVHVDDLVEQTLEVTKSSRDTVINKANEISQTAQEFKDDRSRIDLQLGQNEKKSNHNKQNIEHHGVMVSDFYVEGQTDDTQMFKDAFSYASRLGLQISIPWKSTPYVITDTVYKGNLAPKISGSGGYVDINFNPSNEKTPFLWLDGEDCVRASVKNLIITGNVGHRRGVFLRSEGMLRQSNFENIQFSWLHTCFEWVDHVNVCTFRNVRSIAVEYHHFMNNPLKSFNNISMYNCNFRATTYGIYLNCECNNVTFYDGIFDIKDSSNSEGRGGIYFTFPRNVNFVGGYVEARHQSVFEFDTKSWMSTYKLSVKFDGMYIRDNIASTGIRVSTAIKCIGEIDLNVTNCFFTGWQTCIDFAQSTGTLIDENNNFANTGRNLNLSSSVNENYLNEFRGVTEFGNNNNGRFIKYIDGTMICYHTVTTSATQSSTWAYPESFVAAGTVQVTTGISYGGNEITCVNLSNRTSTNISMKTLRISPTGTTEQISTPVYLTATGRWK